VRAHRSLKTVFTWWFAGTLLVLYGVVAVAVGVYMDADARRDVVLTLKSEAEAVAAYIGASGRLDAPELAAPELDPVPLWMRVLSGDEVLAATPGVPVFDLPAPALPGGSEEAATARAIDGGRVMVVRHAVGGLRDDLTVEAVGSLEPVIAARERTIGALVLLGLVVIPLAAAGGRLLATGALRPVAGLVADIEQLDSNRLDDRLELPPDARQEVMVLAGAFNDLLDRLQGSVESMRRFTADASHELRNPLSVLRTGLEVALRRPRPEEEYRALLRENLEEIHRVQVVVEGLLALARDIPGDAEPLVTERVDLKSLVTDTAAGFSTYAAEAEVEIDLDLDAGSEVEGDPGLLRLLLFNLLHNAIKHSPEGSAVRVEVRGDSGHVHLVVRDSGPGVPAAERDRVFERFYRAGGSGRSVEGSGGLGLAVVRWVTERHQGSIRLLDEGPGAAFQVTLSASSTGAQLGSGASSASSPAKSPSCGTVTSAERGVASSPGGGSNSPLGSV